MQGFIDQLNSWNYHLGQVVSQQLAAGSLAAVFGVFAAGVVTSFTPCVYPVYPVTITFIGGSAGGNRRRAFALSLVYVLGLAAVYAALGVTAALLGKRFGSAWQSPWVFAPVGLLLIAFGLSMFDVFTISLPASLTGLQGAGVRRGGFLLFVFALGIGLLLLLLGVFAGLVTSLPRPGRWMNGVKWGFGTLMIVLGVYWLWKAWALVSAS